MFRGLLSSRLIQVGLVFFVVVVSGSLLYSWQARRATVAEFTRTDIVPHETRSEQDTVDTSTVDFEQTGTLLETDDSQMADDSEVSPIDETSEMLEMADAFLPDDFVSEEAPAEDMPVSPYGFGPYPEVPAGYPLPQSIPWEWSEEQIARMEKMIEKANENMIQKSSKSFTDFLKENELMARVGIKLWNEGRNFNGITTIHQTGLFYPNEPDVLYVEWRETTLPNGEVRRYMSHTTGSAMSSLSIAAREGREPPPDWLEIRSLNEGIDPYEYLGLNR